MTDSTNTKNWLKTKLQNLKRASGFHFSEDIFLSILLCLMAGDKHLILTSKQEHLEDLKVMTEQIFLHIFSLSCSVVACDSTQTQADFTANLFSRPRDDINHTHYGYTPSSSGADESIHRVKKEKSQRSIRTTSSTNSNEKKSLRNFEVNPVKRRSTYSFASTYSTSTHDTKESLFLDGAVMEDPQDPIQTDDDENSLLFDADELGGPEKHKERAKAADVEQVKMIESGKDSHISIVRPQIRRRNTAGLSSSVGSSEPIDMLTRPTLNISTRKNAYYHSHLHPFSQFPITPLDFTIPRKRHESISTGGGQDPPSSFTSSRKLAHAVIIEELPEANEDIHAYLVEMLIQKQVTDRAASHIFPKPFIVVVLLPLSNARHNLPNQLLDRIFISYTYEPGSSTVKSPLATNRRNVSIRNSEIEELSRKIDKVTVHNDMQRYIRDVVVGVRTHRLVKGIVTARASSDLSTLVKALAVISQRNFVTPDLVLTAGEKVLSHRLIIREASDDKSRMYGTNLVTLLKARNDGLTMPSPGDIVASVLQAVRPPV